MPSLYYFVLWKNYLEEKNTWEPLSAVIYSQKLINIFYKEHPKKPTTTSLPLDSIPPMVKLLVLKKLKQNHDRPNKGVNKKSRNYGLHLPIKNFY